MKRFSVIALMLLLVVAFSLPTSASAATSPGIKPGSFLYFFDITFEKIALFFTFSPEKKAEKALEYANERLAEAEAVTDNIEAVKTAITNYESNIAFAEEKSKDIRDKEKAEALLTSIADNTPKHQEVLMAVLVKVPDEAKEAITRAIEASRKGHEEAIQKIAELKGEVEQLKQEVAELKSKDEEREKVINELSNQEPKDAPTLVPARSSVPKTSATPTSQLATTPSQTQTQTNAPQNTTTNQSPNNTTNTTPPLATHPTTFPPTQSQVTPEPSPVVSPPPTPTPTPTQLADTSPPVISDVQVKNITINSAIVSWKTDEQSDAKLEYSTDSFLGQPQVINQVNFAIAHSVELPALQVGTDYYFRITARDQSGNETKSEIKKFATIAIGSLSFALAQDNPPAKNALRTNYGTAAENEIEFLRIKLTASAEEDIVVQSISTAVTNGFGIDHSEFYIDAVKFGSFCCGKISPPQLIISAGDQKILSFRIAPLQDGQTLLTALKFLTSEIVTVGKLSGQQVKLLNTSTIVGNEITLIGVPYFNYSPSALLRDITPGKGRVLEVETGGFMETNLSLHKLTFQVDSTDVANSKWNTCDTGKLEASDFDLTDTIRIQESPYGYNGTWQLLNTNGTACLTNKKVAYAKFTFDTALSIPQRQTRVLILSVNTNGAAVGDQLKLHLLNDNSSTPTNLEWSRADDGVRRSGYRLRNLPVSGVPIRYSSLCSTSYCAK